MLEISILLGMLVVSGFIIYGAVVENNPLKEMAEWIVAIVVGLICFVGGLVIIEMISNLFKKRA